MLRRAFILIVLNFLATGHGGHHAGHHASLSAEELEEIRGQIIRSLGLNHEPDVTKVNVTDEEKAEAYEIYSQRVREKQNGGQNDVNEDGDSEELESFPAIVDSSSSEDDNFPIRLRIPVRQTSSTPRAALLRVFKLVHNEPDDVIGNRWSHRASPPIATIFVYRVSPNNATLRSLVATQTIIVKDNEWEAIDVSPIVYTLPNTTPTEVILDVDCEGCEVHGLQISLRSEDKSPALDLFWTSNDDDDNSISNRKKRSLNRHGKKNKKQSAASSPDMYNRATWSGATDCSKGNRKKCCRHRMYVNFTHLRMDFVVEPKGFEAYYCKGKCPRLYNPAHTHALIQSTMHAWSKAPKPCCAPSKLSNLTIMHYDENRKLKVTDWTNAVVEECACS